MLTFLIAVIVGLATEKASCSPLGLRRGDILHTSVGEVLLARARINVLNDGVGIEGCGVGIQQRQCFGTQNATADKKVRLAYILCSGHKELPIYRCFPFIGRILVHGFRVSSICLETCYQRWSPAAIHEPYCFCWGPICLKTSDVDNNANPRPVCIKNVLIGLFRSLCQSCSLEDTVFERPRLKVQFIDRTRNA